MTIGQRIKQARKANNLSLRKLADRVGISAMAISKYERDRSIPSSAVVIRLADALGVKIDFFFRPASAVVQLQAYRKHAALGVKAQDMIQMRIQDWVERYLEVESLFPDEKQAVTLPIYSVNSLDQIENAALQLRETWNLGLDPIENLVQLLEDRGIKVGLISGFEHFDACTFKIDNIPVIVSKSEIPGDRQRFNVGHELGHIVLDVQEDLDAEQASHRFVGAFLVPAISAHFELGNHRTDLNVNELNILKQKYGLSMQAWIHRAADLDIISGPLAERLYKRFRINSWRRTEPGEAYPSETPMRMERLIYRALAEDLISHSMAQELLGKPLPQLWMPEALQQNELAIHPGD
jgi:transcriptional regulator with XRE-family HTH domain